VFGTTGYGAAYRFRLTNHMALGATVTVPGGDSDTGLAAEARFARTSVSRTTELAGGMIGESYYGAGSTLFGSKYRNSFLLQWGALVLPTDITKIMDNIFLCLEPRFIMGPTKLNLTLFALPGSDTNLQNLLFVPFVSTPAAPVPPATTTAAGAAGGAAGVGITFYSDSIPVGLFRGTLGLAVAAGLDHNLGTLIAQPTGYVLARHLHAQVSPFFDVEMQNGVFRLRLGIDPLGQNAAGASDMMNTIQFHLGYLTRF
jgi:hypothetical protein